jgi:hypothetical protein
MERLNLISFYNLGRELGRLQSVAIADIKLTDWRWMTAIQNAKQFLEPWEKIETKIFPKTAKAATALAAIVGHFSKLLGSDRIPASSEWSSITNEISQFYKVFEQELEDSRSFLVTPIGAYSVSVLHEDASAHLSKRAQAVIGEEQKLDFNKAGECLSFDLYTACGFHAMRALEAEARSYHKIVTEVELWEVPLGTLINGNQTKCPGSGLKPQWVKEGSANDSQLGLAISLLSQINAIYRRPLMHPEMTLDYDTAKLVFDLAAIVISTMVTDGFSRFTARQKATKEPPGSPVTAKPS